ncbi:hypothetical protein [Halobacteriovorax sp. DPLXC-1]|uniref:hypothetical protein n=1 Tax=unclassified Halobacteriovorax TaxID=2639665 RepID=UPI002FF3E9A5
MNNKIKKLILLAAVSTQALALVKVDGKVDVYNCNELKRGQEMRVNFSPSFSRTRVEMKYTLKRANVAGEHYLAYINLNIKSDNSKLRTRLLRHIKSCYETKGSNLVDGAGRKLSLRLWDKSTRVDKPPKVNIGLQGRGARSNSRNYAVDLSCGTVVHEALHLMGLVDEYEEKWNAWNPNILARVTSKPIVSTSTGAPVAMNCRVLGAKHSVMRNHGYLNYRKDVIFTKHMDTIIYANCKPKNKDVYSCMKNAYRTTEDHGGFYGCREMDSSCFDENWQGY